MLYKKENISENMYGYFTSEEMREHGPLPACDIYFSLAFDND